MGALPRANINQCGSRYCLFGDTIYLANRMEADGVPSRIHVSEPSKKLGHKTNPSFQIQIFKDRGNFEVKGKGVFHTYFLEKNDRKSVWEICNRKRENHQSIDGYGELHSDNALPGASLGGVAECSAGIAASVNSTDGMESGGKAAPALEQKGGKENGYANNLKEDEDGLVNGRAATKSRACSIL